MNPHFHRAIHGCRLFACAALLCTFVSAAAGPSSKDDRLGAAIAEAPKAKTEAAGGTGGTPFEQIAPDNGLLVGFDVWEGDYGCKLVIVGLRPIFQTPEGRIRGQLQGEENGRVKTLEAREGYAVTGMDIRSGDRVDGFRLLYARVNTFSGRIEATGGSRSNYVGGQGGSKRKQPLSSGGKPVIGCHGGSGTQVDRIGLVYADTE